MNERIHNKTMHKIQIYSANALAVSIATNIVYVSAVAAIATNKQCVCVCFLYNIYIYLHAKKN